jgi:hypothetical protein
MNGIPWWYFYKNGGRFEGHQLQSVDPAGRQWQFIGHSLEHLVEARRCIGHRCAGDRTANRCADTDH